jgi:hypothetical protein
MTPPTSTNAICSSSLPLKKEDFKGKEGQKSGNPENSLVEGMKVERVGAKK